MWNLPDTRKYERYILDILDLNKSEKVGLRLNIQKTKITASNPINSWQIDGETMETVTDYFFEAPKSLQVVTAAMKLKDTPWKESYDQPR